MGGTLFSKNSWAAGSEVEPTVWVAWNTRHRSASQEEVRPGRLGSGIISSLLPREDVPLAADGPERWGGQEAPPAGAGGERSGRFSRITLTNIHAGRRRTSPLPGSPA